MRVTCFFFLSCKSSCTTCIYNTTEVFIKNTDCKKKNFLGLQYQEQKIHNNIIIIIPPFWGSRSFGQ